MQTKKSWSQESSIPCFATLLIVILLAGSLSVSAQKGKGGGGGETEDNSGHAPATITMRDCKDGYSASAAFIGLYPDTLIPCPVENDRVRSDTGWSYIGGQEGVEAYIGTKGTAGNIWLKTISSPRSVFLDLTDCASPPAECKAPFTAQEVPRTQIYVEVSAVRRNGVFGMQVGESLATPARIYYRREEDSDVGFIEFNPNLTGKNPCKNRGNLVNVTRTGQQTWEVLADPNTLACVTLPGGGAYGGTYRMPFRFHVRLHD